MLLPSRAAALPQPFQLVPLPRGALASLRPVRVDVGDDVGRCPEGTVVLEVR